MKILIWISSLLILAACGEGFSTKPLVGGTGLGGPSPTPTTTPSPTPTPPNGGELCGDSLINWTNPTTNTDSSPITDPLARNVIHYGVSPGAFSNEVIVSNPPAQGSYRLINLEVGQTYYFAVSAVNMEGVASDKSNTATKYISACAPAVTSTEDELIIDTALLRNIPKFEINYKTDHIPKMVEDDVPKAAPQL
jgi:hypothetical protein